VAPSPARGKQNAHSHADLIEKTGNNIQGRGPGPKKGHHPRIPMGIFLLSTGVISNLNELWDILKIREVWGDTRMETPVNAEAPSKGNGKQRAVSS
jgi:hypothetical protein